VVVRGDLAETVVEQRFFNGSDRAVPVEYRLRVPQGALVRSFAVERGESTVEGRPAMIASRNASGGGSVALLGTHKADELVAGLGYLSPGEHVRVALGYTAWLSRDGAHRAYVLPLGDPNDAPRVGEFALDMDLSRAGGRSVRLPDGARFVEGRVQMRRSDWRPRSDLVVDLVDHAPPSRPPPAATSAPPAAPTGTTTCSSTCTSPAAPRPKAPTSRSCSTPPRPPRPARSKWPAPPSTPCSTRPAPTTAWPSSSATSADAPPKAPRGVWSASPPRGARPSSTPSPTPDRAARATWDA
jgi:hypothetical protein